MTGEGLGNRLRTIRRLPQNSCEAQVAQQRDEAFVQLEITPSFMPRDASDSSAGPHPQNVPCLGLAKSRIEFREKGLARYHFGQAAKSRVN